MSFNDLPPPHIDAVQHRKEATPQKIKESKPLFSCEPLPHDRQKKPVTRTVKKRKVVLPTTPALTFDPKRSHVPSGRQDPPVSPSFYSRPSTSESSASSHDDQTSPFTDHDIQDQYFNPRGRPRILSDCPPTEGSAPFYPDTPCTEMSEMSSVPPDCYEPASPSSSIPPNQPVDFSLEGIHSTHPMYAYGTHGYTQQPVVHPDYSYPVDHYPNQPVQNYPIQHPDTAQYSESDGYPYPPAHGY